MESGPNKDLENLKGYLPCSYCEQGGEFQLTKKLATAVFKVVCVAAVFPWGLCIQGLRRGRVRLISLAAGAFVTGLRKRRPRM